MVTKYKISNRWISIIEQLCLSLNVLIVKEKKEALKIHEQNFSKKNVFKIFIH